MSHTKHRIGDGPQLVQSSRIKNVKLAKMANAAGTDEIDSFVPVALRRALARKFRAARITLRLRGEAFSFAEREESKTTQ